MSRLPCRMQARRYREAMDKQFKSQNAAAEAMMIAESHGKRRGSDGVESRRRCVEQCLIVGRRVLRSRDRAKRRLKHSRCARRATRPAPHFLKSGPVMSRSLELEITMTDNAVPRREAPLPGLKRRLLEGGVALAGGFGGADVAAGGSSGRAFSLLSAWDRDGGGGDALNRLSR